MLTILHGRVEMDPMRVPAAAPMARPDEFERVLQQAVAARVEPADEPSPPPPDPAPPAPSAHDEAAAEARSDAAALPRSEPEPTFHDPAAIAASAAKSIESTAAGTDIRRGEPVRQELAGKGADSPRPFAPAAETSFAMVAQPSTAAPAVVTGGTHRITGISGVRASGNVQARGQDMPPPRSSNALAAPNALAAYGTHSASAAQAADVRDSVFKQILMRLTAEGGEMRLRLEPPELGELDLRLVVESGNKLNLSIAAERQDIAHLLQRHLDELKHSLQQAGLDVTGAEVQTRDEFERGQRDSGAPFRRPEAAAASAEPAPVPRHSFVVAEGLDFWA
jgi:flagellar hook-length control protein FliK